MSRRRTTIFLAALVAVSTQLYAFDESRLSQRAADKMEHELNDFLARRRQGRPLPQTVVFTEQELNSYLYYKASPQLPPNLRNIEISLQSDWVVAEAEVDLSQQQGQAQTSLPDFLRRPIAVHMDGKLTTSKGWGFFQPSNARIGFLPLPVSLLDAIVQYVTEKQTGKPHSLNSWFPLPYGIQEVRIQQERVVVVP